MEIKEIVKELNELEIIQKSYPDEFIQDLPDSVYKKYFYNNFIEVDSGLKTDKHRWYETSITVFKFNNIDGYLGVRLVSTLYSESMSIEDCYNKIEFFEMEEKIKITYKIKD